MPGVFLHRWAELEVPEFSIGLDQAGNLTGSFRLHLGLDVCPLWIKLAIEHQDNAIAARGHREAAWCGTDETAKSAAMEFELEESIQAIVCMAIALDAFYERVRSCLTLPPPLIQQWKRKKTARHAQLGQIVRRAFKVGQPAMRAADAFLKQVFDLRDSAVHPDGRAALVVSHPEIDVAMEQKFVTFRAANAEAIVQGATWIICQLAFDAGHRNQKVARYAEVLAVKLRELFPNGHPYARLTAPSASAELARARTPLPPHPR